MTDKPLPRREAWLLARRKKRRRVLLWQVGLLLALFGLWQLTTSTGLSDGFLVSSPSRMWSTFLSLCRGGELLRHIGISCLETVVGFLAGTLLGTAVAICMWWWDGVARVLNPYLVVLNALPKTALGPIFIVWMGAGMGSIIVMTLAISLIVTILSMYQGFLGTDGEKLRLMRSLGATRGQILWMLVFPASFPTLFNTLKVNVGLSWVGVIMGEFLVSRAGLGYLIVYGSQVFNMDLVMTSVLILAAAAVVMYRLVLGACDETYLKLVNSTAEDCASYYDENMTLQAQAFMNVFDVNDLDGTQTDRFADIMKQVYAQAEYTVGAVSQVDDTHFLVDVTVTPLDFPKQVNGALYTGLMTFVNAYGDVTDEQLNAMTDEEYAKYEAAWASGIHNGCRIALNNGLNTLEPVTVQMAVSKADDGKWSIDDDSIVKFDQALMFYPESFE